jgi:hypothetical protein
MGNAWGLKLPPTLDYSTCGQPEQALFLRAFFHVYLWGAGQ